MSTDRCVRRRRDVVTEGTSVNPEANAADDSKKKSLDGAWTIIYHNIMVP